MATKSEKTTEFIIQKVAPIFNKHGYSGTSMSDLTKATGLTKVLFMGTLKAKKTWLLLHLNLIFRTLWIKLK